MKMIIGLSGEGKTDRVIELAVNISPNMTSTILTLEDSAIDLATRIKDAVDKLGLSKHTDKITVTQVGDINKEGFLEMLKQVDSDVIFIDGLHKGRLIGSHKESLTQLLDDIQKVEESINAGIMTTLTRHPASGRQGINVIEYGGSE
jgi:signal recognition particle GTPase